MNLRCKLPNHFSDSFLPSYLSNPWIWLAFAILAYYIYKRLGLNSRYTEWQQQREYAAEVAHIKKNPEFYRERMEAMERARQKQQVSFCNPYCFAWAILVLGGFILNFTYIQKEIFHPFSSIHKYFRMLTISRQENLPKENKRRRRKDGLKKLNS